MKAEINEIFNYFTLKHDAGKSCKHNMDMKKPKIFLNINRITITCANVLIFVYSPFLERSAQFFFGICNDTLAMFDFEFSVFWYEKSHKIL